MPRHLPHAPTSVQPAALPRLVLGPALVAVVAVSWRLLPAGGDDDVSGLVLPTWCLALPFAGVVALRPGNDRRIYI